MADAQGGSAPHVPEQPAGENQTDNEATVTQNSPNSQEIADTALEDHHELAIDDGFGDNDSAYGSSVASTSDSLASSITNYTYENGRRYHAYKEGEYYLPNDEAEQARLDLQHHIYRLCLGGSLFRAPVHMPQSILDIGTGTGIWAIEIADEFPGARVIGTDLSPIQPGFVPPNVRFYVDDFEQEWEFPEVGKFDFIHWRSLSGSTNDWAKLYKQAYNNLKPGAWIEVQEYDAWVFSDDDPNMENAPCTREWCETITNASARFGKQLNVGRFHRSWMDDAGFVDVEEKLIKVPLGPWTRDTKLKELGHYERWHMNESVEAHSMALYTRVLGFSAEEAQIKFALIRKEFNDKNLHLYTVYRFFTGRRPEYE